MTVDVYADIACPWCYVGGARFDQALEQRPDLEVNRRWRPFQLQPDMPPEGRDFRSVLEAKFGGWERAEQMFDRIREMGADLDLTFNFDEIDVAPNTVDAHRLVLWAADQGRAEVMAETLFRAYFTEGRNVSARDVLVDCAEAAGLDADAAREMLSGDAYADAVSESQKQAQRYGVTGVPCYIFNDRHAVTGAQPPEVLLRALDEIEEGQPNS